MMVRGSVDVVTGTEIRGWAFSPGRREPVLVQAVLNHEILGEATASQHRFDLAAAGLGDGNSGFSIQLFRTIDPLYLPFIVVKIDGGDAELPRAPMLGFAEFFASLYAAYPASGRPRSVFGGLWTDRTDAVAILRSKIEIAQIKTEDTKAIECLIRNGFAIVSLGHQPLNDLSEDKIHKTIESTLTDRNILSLLQAVLEDNPIAVNIDCTNEKETDFRQPSAFNPSRSPAEIVAIVIPVNDDVVIEIVRDSHCLPEFTSSGASRWGSRSATDGMSLANPNGLLDRYTIPSSTAAVIGPGTIYRVQPKSQSAATQVFCLPSRGLPLAFVAEEGREELVSRSGLRVWLSKVPKQSNA